MSLAEPRKRRKNPMHGINLTVQNHWSNDDSKFGQRMLEKFGWSKGAGLGKNKQGISENIRVQQKITPTGLGFVAHDADDWFKAGEDYSRLLSQLTEKFDQYQALSVENGDNTPKKSLVENSLSSRSRVHYHKFTKGKDLTQYKKDELTCILGKGAKDEDPNVSSLNMQEYFKIKRESKMLPIDKSKDTSINEESVVIIADEINENIKSKKVEESKTEERENNTIPLKKKKRESKLSKGIELSNECNSVQLKEKKKKPKGQINDSVDDEELLKKKKKKSKVLTNENLDNEESQPSEKISDDMEIDEALVLPLKYQILVDLLIENSSAGKKYCINSSSPLFEKRMKKFTNSARRQYSTPVCSEIKPPVEEPLAKPMSVGPKKLNPNCKDFVFNFEAQKTKQLESLSIHQEESKYVNEKSMFIANHGDVLFFGSNINDIKGYGD